MADIKEIADHRWTADPNLATELPVPAGVAINPMTTAGDLIIGGAAGAEMRLPAGTSGQVLNIDSVSGLPAWVADTDAGFATPAIVLGTAAAAGVAATVIRSDATVVAFDATAPTTSAVGDAAATGVAAVAARRDHVHGREAFATPAVVLGTAAAAGVATTHIRSDSTIVAFDATAPVTQAYSDVAATGSAAVAARRDHKHGMPAASGVSFPLTNSADETFQPNSVASNALTLHNNASAVNGITITGTATGLGPTLNATGANTNVDLNLNSKGSGAINLTAQSAVIEMFGGANPATLAVSGVNGAVFAALGTATATFSVFDSTQSLTYFAVKGVSSGVNGMTLTSSATGAAPTLASTGSDTNIGHNITGKGTGSVTLNGAFAVDSFGHLISTASGTPATSNLGTNVTSATFTGNDVRGTIAIVMSGALAANTRVCTATFANSYGATAPKVTLVDQTSAVGLTIVNSYVLSQSTGVSFDIAFDQALAAGTYTIDYIVIG